MLPEHFTSGQWRRLRIIRHDYNSLVCQYFKLLEEGKSTKEISEKLTKLDYERQFIYQLKKIETMEPKERCRYELMVEEYFEQG